MNNIERSALKTAAATIAAVSIGANNNVLAQFVSPPGPMCRCGQRLCPLNLRKRKTRPRARPFNPPRPSHAPRRMRPSAPLTRRIPPAP